MRTQLLRPPEKKGTVPLPIFVGYLLWPNSWMDQDATWNGDKHRPRRCCVRLGYGSPLLKGAQPPPVFDLCLCQTAGCIKTPLGMEVDLVPGHNVLDRYPAVPLFSAHFYCGHGRPSHLLLSSCVVLPFSL